jgi:hypothetical protein
MKNAIEKFGFEDLINEYRSEEPKTFSSKDIESLEIKLNQEFIIAPQALTRNDAYSSEKLNKYFIPKIQEYYSNDSKVVNMISTCFSEVFLNFWQHAEDDTNSIIVAHGGKTKIEIACTDNGKGILTTLKLSNNTRKTDLETFLSSLEKNVTSKKMSNHMGYGLFALDEMAKLNGGKFLLISEGYFYQRMLNGKTESGKCGNWRGTIVFLSLDTNHPITWEDILPQNGTSSLKLNWQ